MSIKNKIEELLLNVVAFIGGVNDDLVSDNNEDIVLMKRRPEEVSKLNLDETNRCQMKIFAGFVTCGKLNKKKKTRPRLIKTATKRSNNHVK